MPPSLSWLHPSIERHGVTIGWPLLQAGLILLAAWLLNGILRGLLGRVCRRYAIDDSVFIGIRRLLGTVIYAIALVLMLGRLGVSGSALWATFTGFAAVAAVAFFAAWSVLSNIFCTLLILTTRPFRLGDHIELLENGEKPGLSGRVADINLIYTTLQETHADGSDTVLQVPNSHFFQRTVRRWRPGTAPPPLVRPGSSTEA